MNTKRSENTKKHMKRLFSKIGNVFLYKLYACNHKEQQLYIRSPFTYQVHLLLLISTYYNVYIGRMENAKTVNYSIRLLDPCNIPKQISMNDLNAFINS